MNTGLRHTSALAKLLAGAAVALALGLWEGHLFAWVALYGIGVAALLLYRREQFAHWIAAGGEPNFPGRWGQIAHEVERQLASQRRRRGDLQQLLRRYFEATSAYPDGVIALDDERRIDWMNGAAERMLDLDRERDAGRRLNNLVRHPQLHRAIELGEPAERVILESPVEQGQFVSLQVIALAGQRRMVVVRDVTEHESSETARRDFVANASHELRSPLTVIRGYLDALADDDMLDPEWSGPVEEMRHQAQCMSHLLRDLMDLARLDRVYRRAALERVRVAPLLERVRADLLVSAEQHRNVTLNVQSDADIQGEEAELALVVTNLLSNALRYTEPDGHIEISWTVDAAGGHLEVRDDGIGIPEEDIPRLTQRFYRVDKGRSRAEGGTGLGLAIVRNALERHDAQLEIRSRLGYGSVFTCHFPPERIADPADDARLAS